MRSIPVLIALVVSQASPAQERRIPVDVLGYGNLPCGNWNEERSGTDAASIKISYTMMGWVEGYVTSALIESDSGRRKFGSTGTDLVFSWIDGYCKIHTSDSLALGAAAFARYLAAESPN